METKQFWVDAPRRSHIVTAVLPSRQPGEVLCRALYSAVSRGTESLVFRGEVPPSQYQAMRAPFQEGDFPGPLKYGYSSVAEVVEGPSDLTGRTVFCLYPHQDYYFAPVAAVTVLPDRLPPGRAVLAANMETAVNILWDAQPGVGDRVVVVGAGVVGLLCAWLCRQHPGTDVTVVDINPARREPAQALGLACQTESPSEGTADLVIHASGHPDGLQSALTVAGPEATIVEASWFGTRAVSLSLGEAFHARRLTVRSSQVGQVSPARSPRWTRARRMGLAMRLLCDDRLDVLISGESPFETLPSVMARLSDAPGDTLCHRIRY